MIRLANVEDELPNVELPYVELSKVELPNVELANVENPKEKIAILINQPI